MEVDNVVYVDPISNVEQLFKDIDHDLDDLEKKLLEQSGTRTESASSADIHFGVNNLASLLLRLHQIKLDFKEVSDSVAEINAAEKEAVKFLQKSSKSILENLSYLAAEKEVNMDLEPIMNEVQEFSAEFIDGSSQQSKNNGNLHENPNVASVKDPENHVMQNNNGNIITLFLCWTHMQAASYSNPVQALSLTSSHRLLTIGRVVGQDKVKTTGFVPIHERTFLTVSGLVRGKVKVSEVNATYEKLWRYFKEEKNTKPLSSTDMDKMGLRVSGKTGQAKLKVLQSLKMLQMSSKGEVIRLT